MLTAGGRAPPFGDLANCATAADADAGAAIQLADFFAGRWRALHHTSSNKGCISVGSRITMQRPTRLGIKLTRYECGKRT